MRLNTLLLLTAVILLGVLTLRSQAPTVGFTSSATDHTKCAVAPGVTYFCGTAQEGLWQSVQGSAYVQLGVVVPASWTTLLNKPTGFTCTKFTRPAAGQAVCAQGFLTFQ